LQVILQNYWGCVNKNLPLLRIILLFTSVFMSTSLSGMTETGAVDALIERAREMQLGDKPAWLNLLHYKSTLLGSRESQADDNGFFLAEGGSYNARAELEADLRGFFSRKKTAHPRCLFPARFHWLDAQLNFKDLLPPVDCVKFNNWKEKFKNVEQLTLLFPSMHLENPSSMFGHTFIRFDRPDNNHLLSYTLSYAASYDESDHVLVYSWKGISGGYPGKFFLQAYFETLQEYSDIEQRDIWEYKLNFSKQEIKQLIRHLWEVKGVHFEYYFFRENCSFRLLALLDVARENINMSIDAHPLYAIPVDTVRDVEQVGFITERNYRPATHNKISQMSKQLGEQAGQIAISISNNEYSIQELSENFSIKQQAKILQLADELLNQKKNLSTGEAALQFEILSARSHLPVTQEEVEFSFNATPPEQSHKSARWQFSTGEHEQQRFYETGLRPAFHDLLDVSKGFVDGASISVLETQLRWYKQEDRLKLESLNFFSLQSIVPVKPWAAAVSRKISFKLKQRDLNVAEQITEFETQFSMGYATEIKSILMYAMVRGQLEYATELIDNHGLYLGADMGSLWQLDNNVISAQTEINYQLLQAISGEQDDVEKLRIGIQFNILKDHALRFEYEMIEYDQFEVEEGKLSYLIYF